MIVELLIYEHSVRLCSALRGGDKAGVSSDMGGMMCEVHEWGWEGGMDGPHGKGTVVRVVGISNTYKYSTYMDLRILSCPCFFQPFVRSQNRRVSFQYMYLYTHGRKRYRSRILKSRGAEESKCSGCVD